MAGCLPLSACTEVEAAEVTGYEPATLETVKGGDLKRVTFTPEGARRTALRTRPVQRLDGRTAVPHAAVIYAPGGTTSVYIVVGPRSFERRPVSIDRVEGDWALISRGPPAGSIVVTVGAAEVYGAELEIAGSH
jgi:multidrug efflux pump subunit AcrA (membrane-fusion protein)